jgi:hypothetical protein
MHAHVRRQLTGLAAEEKILEQMLRRHERLAVAVVATGRARRLTARAARARARVTPQRRCRSFSF